MKYKIDIAPLSNYYVVVVKDKETDKLIESFTINESGADMLRLFCQTDDIGTVSERIAEKYDVSPEQVSKDVETFACKLKKRGLL